MKKIILILGCGLLLTGCDLNYEINFDYNSIYENINAEIDGNIYEIASDIDGDGFYLEKELVENNIPSIKEYKDFYSKDIDVIGNKSYVNLSYQYSYEEFKNSYLLSRCFEEVYVINNADYLYVSLGGNFKCFKDNDITIKVSSKYKVIEHNADDYKDGYYTWKIKMADDENIVDFKIVKEKAEESKTSVFLVLKIILGIIMVFVGAIIFFFKKNMDKNKF